MNLSDLPRLTTLSTGAQGLRGSIQTTVTRAKDIAGPVLDFIASDDTIDRYDEVVEPSGWRLDNYRKNPVFQNSHRYGDILFTLGKSLRTEVRDVGGRQALTQRIEFATEINPVAKIAHDLYANGYLHAVSVGFIPLRWEDPPALSPKSASNFPKRRYLEQELLELSAVSIPANPNALALGLKSGAIDPADLKEAFDLMQAFAGRAECPWPTAKSPAGPPAPPDLLAGLITSAKEFLQQSATPGPNARAPGAGSHGAQLLQEIIRTWAPVVRRA